jgi:hypothetical protein
MNPEGQLIYQGAIDSIPSTDPKDVPQATNYLEQCLEESMAGKEVSRPVTTPYGCSVKY